MSALEAKADISEPRSACPAEANLFGYKVVHAQRRSRCYPGVAPWRFERDAFTTTKKSFRGQTLGCVAQKLWVLTIRLLIKRPATVAELDECSADQVVLSIPIHDFNARIRSKEIFSKIDTQSRHVTKCARTGGADQNAPCLTIHGF
jgi:hypothetical protein